MSPSVTWYRITKLVVVLGLAIAKYVSGSANVGTVDLACVISTGGILYFIGWWEEHPRMEWYFEPDWQAQRRAMIACVVKLKDLIYKVISIYANELICVLLLICQIPMILIFAGKGPYQGESLILKMLIGFISGALFGFPLYGLVILKRRPLTPFERVIFGISAVPCFYISYCYIEGPFIDNGIHEEPLWVILLALFAALSYFLMACLYVVLMVRGGHRRQEV